MSNILIYSDLKDFDSQIISLLNNDSLENIGNNGCKFVEENLFKAIISKQKKII